MKSAKKSHICNCIISFSVIIILSLIPLNYPAMLSKIISSTYYAIVFVVVITLIYCLIFFVIKRFYNKKLRMCLKTAEFVVIIAGSVGILSCVKDIEQSYSITRLGLLNTWITNDSTYLGIESYKKINSFPYNKSNYRTEDEHQLLLDENKIRFQWANEVDSLTKTSLRNLEIRKIPRLEDKYQDQGYEIINDGINRICSYNKEIAELKKIANSNKMGLITIGTYILLIAISLQLSIFFFKS